MRRLGFIYKKPQSLPAQADEIKQAAFIDHYEALMTGPGADEMVVVSDAVHPEHQSRPAYGWFPKIQKIALKATSGRKRLNIQGALDLETFQFTFVQSEKINAQTIQQMLEKLEAKAPTMTAIHVFLDNARCHHAKILQPGLQRSERQGKLHFLTPYAPHLNPIERLWGVMHKWVTHNRHYATFNKFTEAILAFFCKTLPEIMARIPRHRHRQLTRRLAQGIQSGLRENLRSIQAQEYITVFDSYEDIIDKCEDAWNFFENDP